MNYILTKLDQKITFLKRLNQNEQLRVHYQAKLETLLLLMLSYLWNKNWEKIETGDKEYCIENILKPSNW